MILFEKVSKKYTKGLGSKAADSALSNLSFNLQRGESLGLIGANGAGKSTTIKLLMDFIRPSNGRIVVFDASPSSPQIRKKIGHLPEITNLPGNLSVSDVLRFTAATCGISREMLQHRSGILLNFLDLWDVRYRPLRTYSKGMQQRANFVIALINDPELLILDEPMSGLDPIGRKMIIDLIKKLKSDGKTILFCSHILEDVDSLVDNILLLHKGRKIFYGAPKELSSEEQKNSLAEAFVSRINREMQHG